MSKIKKHMIGRKVIDVSFGESFIEITLDDKSVVIIESTDYKATKHQDFVNINVMVEKK